LAEEKGEGISLSASYVVEGDLTEKQIEADVAQYLGWCSHGLPFRLHDVNEQLTGADKMSDVTVPIYIQFKKSTGLRAIASHPIKRRLNESSLQAIRRFRAHHELPDDPTLYFELRKLAEGATDFQHNILLAHHCPPSSYAIYVAPLHLNRRAYYDELCAGPRFLDDPWDWQFTELMTGWGFGAWLSRFDRQPFLRNHVSIPPHQQVNDHHHHYAYSTAGDSITWHSGEILERGTSRLSDFLTLRTRQLLSQEYDLPSPEQGLDVARQFLKTVEGPLDVFLDGDGPLDQLHNYGRWLWKEHGIRQILLLGRRDILTEIRSVRK
jgi:hypothetical protein